MNMKKILSIGLILIAVSCTVAAVSAIDTASGEMSLVNNNLTINGINFNVPDGYEQVDTDDDKDDADGEDIDGTHVDLATSAEFKNGADKLEVEVGIKSNDAKIESINPSEFEPKQIKDKVGFIKNDDGKVKFEYLQDGKLVKIEAANEDIINQVIV